MGIRKFISNLFAPDEEKKKKPAGTTSQASAASTGTRAVGKTVVKTPTTSTTEKKTETKTKKSGTSTKKSDTAKAKSETKKSTDSRRTVAAGKTTVKLPTEQKKKDAKSPISEAWNNRKETVAQKQVQQVQGRQSKTVSNPGILDKWNSAQKERNAARQAEEQAKKNRQNQMQLLSDAAGSYEARLKAIADRASRAPESITQEDVNAYNDLWTRYQQTLGNYAKAKGEQDAEEQLRKTQKKSAQQQILAAMGAGETMQGTTGQQNNTIFDVDPRQQIINAQIAGQGAQTAAQQRAQQLPKTLAAIGLGGIAAAQDTVGTAMGMGEQAAWALSPGAQKDAAQRADHAQQTAAWQQENRDAQKKMEKAFALTEDDALGQFLVELNYNFVQQGISTVAGGIFGKAGGTALSALGKEASAAGGNLAGRIGSQAAQRAAASAQVGGKALQGAARYLQKNAPLATMATLAGANNYQAAIGGGANEGQAMAYAVLTGAAEAVTEKLFGGNPLMDNEAGWVNRVLYKMLGDKKFLKALDSVPVDTFNEGFEEVIANYLYSAAQAATGQQVELPSTEENLHSFALGAALGGMGQAAKLAGNAMRQRSADTETGELLQRMGAGNELIAAGLALPGSRAEMHATELRLRNQQPTARELGRQYRENVRAQDLLTAKQLETENTVRRMAENVGAQVAFDATISDAAGHDSAADGYYKDNVLHIARDADKPAMTVAVHEITHYLQQAAPEQYRTFREYAMRLQGNGAMQAMQERYARGGVELTEEEAMDEIAASTAEKLLTDRGSIESLIRENPSVAQRFFDALREFIRKLTGRVDPQLRQAEKLWTEAYKAAGSSKKTAQTGGKAQYLMAGRNARGADLDALNRAVEMQRDGAKMEDIRKETGWFTGADGKWRFEIDDSGMEYYRMNERIGSDSATLENIIDHEELFRAYPQLRQAKVRFEDLPGGTKGQYDRESNTIRIDQSLRKAPEDTLVHEIQHAIQSAEGFAGGSSPEYWAARDYESGEVTKRLRMERRNEFRQLSKEDQNKYTRYKELEREMDRLESAEDGTEDADRYVKYERESDALYLELWGKPWFQKLVTLDRKLESGLGEEYNRLYRNTAGEIEARDVTARRKLTAEQRRETAPNTGDENTVFAEDAGKSYEINEKFRTDIQAWHKAGQPQGEVFTLGSTGPTLQGLGAIESDIYMNGDKISTILKQHPEMSIREIQRIPEVLENPVLILKSRNSDRGGKGNTRMVLFGSIKARDGRPILCVLDLRPRERGLVLDDMQKVTSAYTKDNKPVEFVESSDVLYADKKRTTRLLSAIGFQMPMACDRSGYIGSIAYERNNVKLKGVPFSSVIKPEGESKKKFSLKEDSEGRKLTAAQQAYFKDSAADLKTMRAERSDVRREIDKLEWLEEKQGYLDETDAAAMKQLRTREKDLTERIDAANAAAMKQLREREKDLTERIDVANAAAKENRGTEAERIMQKAKGEAAAAQPTQAGKTLRQDLLDTFSVQAGRRKELGRVIDRVAARVREQGYATASDGAELFRGLYNAGVVVDTTESEHYAEIRRTLRGVKLHIDETVRAELGDDFTRTRQEAFRNGIILTTKDGEGVGINVEHKEMADLFPGVFDSYNTDRTAQLEDMIRAAELGRPEHISLMEQAMRAGGEDAVAQQMMFLDSYLTDALKNYAKQADFEVRVKQGEIMKTAKARAIAADAWEKQSQRKALAEAQNRTLKVFQRLRRMKKDQNAETKALIDEIVGSFDTMAKTLRKDKEADWRDLRKIYDAARENDPNFLPNESWEQKFSRLDAARVGELSREEALELYQRGVELIHMIRTKDKEIAAENARNLEDLYRNSVHEIRTSDGNIHEYSKGEKRKEKIKGAARRYWNEEQLSPLNMIEKMGGWRRDGAFYSMAKQLERGEYDKQRYIIQSDALLKDFTEKHEKWIAKADGKGKDAIWYEIDAPAFLEAGNGGADLRENKSVKIYMTPMMKVKLYLDSLNYDNLRHINFGGATFPDKQLYAAGNEKAAYARGVTVKMQPGAVKSLVADLTPEEKELAFILGTKYFNGYAKEEINRVSNLLEGHDKAMNSNYSPIYTNANFLGKKADPAIVDATIEGMGPLKNRVWSGKPMLAVSALSAFQKHRDMTAKYVGLAIPVRNMNALLNYTEKDYHDSMREVISKKWGANSVEYLDNLLVNLQNRPAAETTILDDLVNGALNNYVKAVFGFNPGTVVKQAPGFFMAGARLGFDTIPATSMLHSAWGKYRDLMAKYTPIMEWRARGYSTREMAELKNNPNWTQRNRAFKFVFGGAIQWMDLHTCAAIWPWAENYVKKHYPNLKPGSRSEINSGKDAYYKKVAEVFEDAIANSQPMYDDMHTAQILHNNKSVARGITMFHTAQLTQANAIRQAHGEMKRAQAENDKAGLKRGQKAFKDSIMALLISTLSFEAVGALVAIAKRKDKALRDEDGEMTPATIAKYMADATAKDLLGNVVGWDTAYDIGTHFLFGDTWYGFEMPGVDAIQDFIDDAPKLAQAGVKFVGGLSGVTDTGDFQYYLRTAGNDFRKSLKTLALDGSYLVGIPAKNMESYILGLMGWINPDLAAAYNNAWGGSYDKSSVAALGGKPKEQAAAIRKAVRNRAKDASDEAVAELQRLYQTAGTEVLPQAVADTITIETGEDSSEKVELSLKQKSDYQKAYDKVVSAELNQLIASPEYAKLSDDQKAGAVVLLYKYAAEQGKQAAVAEYAPKGWKAKAARAAEEGADVYQTVIYKAATAEIEGDKDENGETIDGSEDRKKLEWLTGSGWSETTQAAIYFAEIASKTRDEKSNELAKKGVSRAEYYRYMVQTKDTTSDKDENGETISGTENKNLYDKLNAMDLSDKQKGLLYFAEIQDYTKDEKYYPKAKAEGVSDWQYASFKANTGVMVSDKDKNGKSITDSKRDKVLGYIDGMDISSAAKDELYFAAGYGEKRLSEAPWHNGKKSGSSKKAQKAAKKKAAARAALATPEMQSYLQKYGVTQANGRPATAADLQSSVERYIRKYTGGRSLPRAGESMNLPSDLPRAGEALTTRDLPRAGEEVQMQSLPTYNDLVNRREKESLDEKYFRKFGRR